jgi:hypothetical protein
MEIYFEIIPCDQDKDLKKLRVRHKNNGNLITEFYGLNSWIEDLSIKQINIIEHVINSILSLRDKNNE